MGNGAHAQEGRLVLSATLGTTGDAQRGWYGGCMAKARSLQPLPTTITPTSCSGSISNWVCLQLEEQASVPFKDISNTGDTSCSQPPSLHWSLLNVPGSSPRSPLL